EFSHLYCKFFIKRSDFFVLFLLECLRYFFYEENKMSDFGYAMIMVVFSMSVVVGLALSIF
ncbi:TPA: hypothetical protein ACPJGD_001582, partial [Haemophilus influenzae]